MTVKVSKAALNLREELADLRKPSGIAGEALLRADTVQEQRDLINAGRKNLIINGGFDVWQRGTSITDSANGPYNYITADHWVTYYQGTYEQTEVTLPNGVTTKAMKFTTAGNAPNFNCPVEDGARLIGGRTVTFSWWMRASKTIPNNIKARVNNSGNGTYASSQYVLNNDYNVIDVTTEWTYHTHTTTLPDTVTYAHAVAEIWGTNTDWDNGDWFEFTNVQLELGSVATEFEHRSYGEELALCMRYFEISSIVYLNTYGSNAIGNVPYKVQKRATPTSSTQDATLSGISTGTGDANGNYLMRSGTTGCSAKLVADAEL